MTNSDVLEVCAKTPGGGIPHPVSAAVVLQGYADSLIGFDLDVAEAASVVQRATVSYVSVRTSVSAPVLRLDEMALRLYGYFSTSGGTGVLSD